MKQLYDRKYDRRVLSFSGFRKVPDATLAEQIRDKDFWMSRKETKKRTVEELRDMLRTMTWAQFKGYKIKIHKIVFAARIGIHFGKPAIVIIAQGQFVVLKYLEFQEAAQKKFEGMMPKNDGDYKWVILRATNPTSGFPPGMLFYPYVDRRLPGWIP